MLILFVTWVYTASTFCLRQACVQCLYSIYGRPVILFSFSLWLARFQIFSLLRQALIQFLHSVCDGTVFSFCILFATRMFSSSSVWLRQVFY